MRIPGGRKVDKKVVAYFFMATLPRSQIGKKMPSARIRTSVPRATIRIGSIFADSVLSS